MAQSERSVDSLAYFQDDVTWCVQKAKSRPKWKQMWVADWKVFVCIFGAIIPVIWIWYGLTGFERRPFDIWTSAIFVVRTVALTPSTFNPSKILHRFFYVYFLLFCFFASLVICSFMFAISTTSFNEHQISTFEEIVNGNFRLAAEGETKQFLTDRSMVKMLPIPF